MLLIDKLSGKPVYEQLIEGIERNILLGLYPPGSALPSLRELSVMLGINPNTIQKSYAELTRRGIISPAPGSGSYVSPHAKEIIQREATEKLTAVRALATELKLAGVPRNDILAVICEVYKGEPVTPSEPKPSSTEGGSES